MTLIIIDNQEFRDMFPELEPLTEPQIQGAYKRGKIYVNYNSGEAGLDLELQEQAVYLATAHIIALSKSEAQGVLSSASEGSVSASFQQKPIKTMFQYGLALTPYGLELLAILEQVQIMDNQSDVSIFPYYNTIYAR